MTDLDAPGRYLVFFTDNMKGDYGPPIFDYDSLLFAVEEAERLCDEGFYSKIVDAETNEVIFVDFYRIVPKDNSLFATPFTPRERLNFDGTLYTDE